MVLRRNLVLFSVVVSVGALCLVGCREKRSFQTCQYCGSTRSLLGFRKKPEKLMHKSFTYEGCQHEWKAGAVLPEWLPAVLKNEILLLKAGDTYGAVILRLPDSQKPSTYWGFSNWECFYQSDGKGTFKDVEPVISDADMYIRDLPLFGPFGVVALEGTTYGGVRYYHPKFVRVAGHEGELLICVTHETDIEQINAADPKWVYDRQTSPNFSIPNPPLIISEYGP